MSQSSVEVGGEGVLPLSPSWAHRAHWILALLSGQGLMDTDHRPVS